MIDLKKLSPVALKAWAKKRVDDFLESRLAKDVKESRELFALSNECEFVKYDGQKEKHIITAGRYGATVNRKVDYLFAKGPTSSEQELLDSYRDILETTAERAYLDGSVLWVVESGELAIMNDAIVYYTDTTRQEILCVCRKVIEIVVATDTGTETEKAIYELYFDGLRYRFTYDDMPSKDSHDDKPETLDVEFIEIGKTGDVPLFTRCKGILRGFERIAKHQDNSIERNTNPLTEVRGYEGTDVDELKATIDRTDIAMTSGTGGVTIHQRNMDSASVQVWYQMLNQLYYEVTATVGKDNEMQYAQSGRALDRLFIDMEAKAQKMGALLETGLNKYFESQGKPVIDILWNTDKPYDDASVIDSVMKSRGFVSDQTLLERHPYVVDVELENQRIAEQNGMGIEDLGNTNDIDTEVI
jgi:hypothetical protein